MIERRQLPGVIRVRRRVLCAPTTCYTGWTRSARHRQRSNGDEREIRPYRRGGWEVDVRVVVPDGAERRERKRAPASSRSAAIGGEGRERELLATAPAVARQRRKEVPTLVSSGRGSWMATRVQSPEAKRDRCQGDDQSRAPDPDIGPEEG